MLDQLPLNPSLTFGRAFIVVRLDLPSLLLRRKAGPYKIRKCRLDFTEITRSRLFPRIFRKFKQNTALGTFEMHKYRSAYMNSRKETARMLTVIPHDLRSQCWTLPVVQLMLHANLPLPPRTFLANLQALRHDTTLSLPANLTGIRLALFRRVLCFCTPCGTSARAHYHGTRKRENSHRCSVIGACGED